MLKNTTNILKIYSYPKIKKSVKYFLPILLGVLLKLNTIGLFIAPIAAIKSVSNGTLSPNLKTIFDFLYLPTPDDENLFTFFLISISFALVTLYLLKDLKDFYIGRIGKNMVKIYLKDKPKFNNKNYSVLKKKISRIEKNINNSTNIAFCILLVLFIVFYDFGIALIILSGGIIYYKSLYFTRSKTKAIQTTFDKDINISSNLNKKLNNILTTRGGDNKLLKPTVSTIVMLLIMLIVYTRTNSEISIIFIFLVRIYQNQMLDAIKSYIK